MGIFEIISAIVLIIACVFIVIVVLMQDTKTQMSQTISGNTGDNYFGKNSGTAEDSGTAESGAAGSTAETSGTAQAGESYAESTASTAEQ